MEGDVTAALGCVELDTQSTQCIGRLEQMLGVAVPAHGNHWGVLQEKEGVPGLTPGDGALALQLEFQRFRVGNRRLKGDDLDNRPRHLRLC